MIFGSQAMADMLCDTEPEKEGVWKVIFDKAQIPEDGCHYKCCINGTYFN